MSIKKVTKVTATCDSCGQEIIPHALFVDASVFGVTFHFKCLDDKTVRVLRILGLDDIKWSILDDDGEAYTYAEASPCGSKFIYVDEYNNRRL